MSKVYHDHDQDWYHEMIPGTLYSEADLQRVLNVYLSKLGGHFVLVKFSLALKNPKTQKNNIPDFVIVKNDYSLWYVVEVELSHHRVEHVAEQLETFSTCDYDPSMANYIADASGGNLNKEDLERMIRTHRPHVLLIANEYPNKWYERLKIIDFEVGTFQAYLNHGQKRLYRFTGVMPLVQDSFTPCRFVEGVPMMVEVTDSSFLDALNVPDGGAVDCEYLGRTFPWSRVDSPKSTYLQFDGEEVPLDPGATVYHLVHDKTQGRLVFQKA